MSMKYRAVTAFGNWFVFEYDPTTTTVPEGKTPMCHTTNREAAEHLAILLNAEDISLRRGWTAVRRSTGRWGIAMSSNIPYEIEADSPAAVLIRAECWHVANIEEGIDHGSDPSTR